MNDIVHLSDNYWCLNIDLKDRFERDVITKIIAEINLQMKYYKNCIKQGNHGRDSFLDIYYFDEVAGNCC